MANVTDRPRTDASQATVADLVKQLSEQTSRLARQEVELAKAELTAKGKRAGIGAGMFGGAAMFGFYALGALAYFTVFSLATLAAFGYHGARTALNIVVALMLLTTLWLLFVQAFILHKFCEYCLLSAAVTLSLAAIVAFRRFARARK